MNVYHLSCMRSKPNSNCLFLGNRVISLIHKQCNSRLQYWRFLVLQRIYLNILQYKCTIVILFESYVYPNTMYVDHTRITMIFHIHLFISQTYAVVGIHSEPCKSVFRLNAEGNKEEDVLVRPKTCVLPTLDYYSLQMYAPNLNANHRNKQSPWLLIPNTL